MGRRRGLLVHFGDIHAERSDVWFQALLGHLCEPLAA
jgi:hypothetical protein